MGNFSIKKVDRFYYLYQGDKQYKTQYCKADTNAVVTKRFFESRPFLTEKDAEEHYNTHVKNNVSCTYKGFTIVHLVEYYKGRALIICEELGYRRGLFNKYWGGNWYKDPGVSNTQFDIDQHLRKKNPVLVKLLS